MVHHPRITFRIQLGQDAIRPWGSSPGEVAGDVTLREGDLLWCDFLGDEHSAPVHHAQPDAPVHVLFSSGTTGKPKAIGFVPSWLGVLRNPNEVVLDVKTAATSTERDAYVGFSDR